MPVDFLLERFCEAGSRDAVVWHHDTFSYQWLTDRIDHWRAWLDERSLQPGAVVLLRADYSPDTIAVLLALIKRSAIVVPICPDSAAHDEQYAEDAQAEYSIDMDNESARMSVLHRQASHEFYQRLRAASHPGLVLFSSGSTGQRKAAVHDLSKLLAKYHLRRHDLRTLAFLHFDHIGGIDTLFYCLSNTSCLVLPDSRSPDDVCHSIQRHQIEVLPVAPTFLTFLQLSGASDRYDLSSLRYVTYGAEVMPAKTLERCSRAFPGATILQKYGTTEVGTLRSRSKGSNSLWVKLGGEGFRTRVVDGCLQIQADSAMLGYLNAPSPFTDDGWFITGDMVEVDGDYYRILGRTADVINVGGEKVFPAEVENVISEMKNIADVTVFGESSPITGQIVCANVTVIAAEDRRALVERLNAYCAQRLESYQVPFKVEIVTLEEQTQRFKKKRS